MYFSLQQADQF
uniref:Uncharacterized protein n=1 Tax=Arundo donax TaxID=35708 RepID=A0A0A9EKC3_ARUDO